MLTMEEYRQIISELMDELPEAFYQKLTGEALEISPTAQTVHDLTVSELH